MLLLCIRNFLKTNPLLFVLFVLLQIISFVSILFTYFDYKETTAEKYIYAYNAANFSVSFKRTEVFENLSSKIEQMRRSGGKNIDCIYISLDAKDTLRAYMFGQNYIINLGKNFDSTDETVISAVKMNAEDLSIGDITKFNEREYKITGIRIEEYSEIPYESLHASDFIDKVNFRLSKLPTNTEKTEFSKKLKEIFGDDTIISEPSERSFNIEYGINMNLLSSYLLFGLSFLNISFILKYLIQKRKVFYTVSKICGAENFRLFMILTAEVFLYTMFSLIIGVAVFRFAILPSTFPKYFFGYKDFLPPLFIFVAFSLLLFIPPLYVFGKSTPIEIKQG